MFIIYLMTLQALSMSPVESTYNRENSLQIIDFSSRITNYSFKTFNIITVTNTVSKNERKLFLQNIFPSSFIFYADESYSNLINRNEILQRHFIYKMPPNKNMTKLRYSEEKYSTLNDRAYEEDYSQEYDDYDISISFGKNKSHHAIISSCSSCQQHEKARKENLESIKKHILMRLQLSQPPNITVAPSAIPQKILDYFYKNFNFSRSIAHQSQFKYISKANKRKTKFSLIDVREKLNDKENINTYLDENKNDDDYDNIIVSDTTHKYFDENFVTSVQQPDEFFSRLHSIYVFPTKSRIRYNRKPEIFNFKFNSDPSGISSTILHVFIKGQDWIYEYQPETMEKENMEVFVKKKPEIMIVIYRALRRPNSMNYAHIIKLTESRQKIPPGFGQWVEIEIKELSTYWMKTPNSTQSIVIRGLESWMRTFIVTEDQNNDKLAMHMEIVTKVNHRSKRNTALDCRESDNEVRCCRYPLRVNFTNFGWNFIVAPQHFDAYFCNGECNVGYLETYTHTHIASLSTSAKPCCSPQKLSPLALLYFDNNNKLMYSTIPNMSVEKCSCS